ncbi:phosphomannomutase [Pseudoalteromonas luteoviolacea]|uniref:Phosphomannomutase n=1 Tax=Pseudoalteromonas luteoviolacea H33 TaxID=1365251 RepID=A0A161Y729_9GAMM|nr:phosphomannomutase [Pseudoalteromonas luteoviolacea]KZN51395.1 phosphomannomutase [Pseudoalteromonas luteoviolacea H33]KZN71434.1 phosphomannomutase [Pseudoalteromonas luteoviolacea H33-S]MBQ4876789.1 phosphomannomutase [Pseudoalteromonas luteoviolacea]MBQ4905422.1 phosphomannomutase [Pseudoalteromonas luteoviolacea]
MNTKSVIQSSGIAFGTSGARGLVVDFTPEVCAAFSIAFAQSIKDEFAFNTMAIAIDNRPSSFDIAKACAAGLKQLNIEVVYYGVVPTPALAYTAMQDNMPCIMVTGSHIPFDRNGLKFYRPDGEITKQDEKAILSADFDFAELNLTGISLPTSDKAINVYTARYTNLFDSETLAGKKVGIYEHSSAGRDIYKSLFEQLGAEVICLGRSDEFIPIDTEAVSEEDKQRAKEWVSEYRLDMLFSTDGDGDRPLVAGEDGEWLRGDILGLLCSQALSIEALATPVSCNTAIELSESFKAVSRTKIGSPYVIAAFAELNKSYARVAGFEANGGYLLASDFEFNGKALKALPTRDAVLPALIVATMGNSIASLLTDLPQRFTVSDRLKDFATEKSKALIAELSENPNALLKNLGLGEVKSVCKTDGLRLTAENGDIVHLRPSGNAPELRCYVEAVDSTIGRNLNKSVFEFIKTFTKRF